MKIILKYILRNITEKKVRTAIIVLAVTLAAAILYLDLLIRDTALDMYKELFTKASGTADISISNDDTYFFPMQDVDLKALNTEDVLPILNYIAKYKQENGKQQKFILCATDMDTAENMELMTTVYSKNVDDSRRIILSESFAKQEGFEIGDKITVTLNDKDEEFVICTVADQTGVFTGEADIPIGVVPLNTLQDILVLPDDNYVSGIYISLKEDTDIDAAIKSISYADEADSFLAEKLVDKEVIDERVSSVSSILLIALLLMIVLAGAVIISLYKHILNDRLPVMATFRSVGAASGKTYIVLLMENSIYGLIGGVLGVIAGTLSMPYIYHLVAGKDILGTVSVKFDPIKAIFCILMTIILAMVTTAAALMGLKKKSVREAIFNTAAVRYKLSKAAIVTGVILIVLSIAAVFIKRNVLVSAGLPVILLAGCILLIPVFIQVISAGVLKLYPEKWILRSVALKNIKNNKVIIQNITIMVIATVLAIGVYAIIGTVDEYLNEALHMNANVVVNLDGISAQDDTETIMDMDFIDDAFIVYASTRTLSFRDNTVTCNLYGRETDDNFEVIFGNTINYEKEAEIIPKNGMILMDQSLLKALDAKDGDVVTLEDKGSSYRFTVRGSMDSYKFASDKRTAFININDFKADIAKVPVAIYIKTSMDADAVKEQISKIILDSDSTVMTFQEFVQKQKEQTNSVMNIIKCVIAIGIVICMIGTINNLIVSYLSRKKEFAALYATSMNRKNIKYMIMLEISGQTVLSLVLWVVISFLMIINLSGLLNLLGVMLDVTYPVKFMLEISAILLALNILSGVCITRSISKLQIMRELRYE